MNFRRIAIIYRKELRDALRDKRTIVSTIVVPILLFPLLTIGFGTLAAKSMVKMQRETSSVMLLGETNSPSLAEAIRKVENIEIVPPAADYVALINDKKLRAVVEIPQNFERDLFAQSTNRPAVKIYYYTGEVRSQMAIRNVQKVIREFSDGLVEKRLSASGLSRDDLKPFDTREENVAAPTKVGGNLIGGIIPYMIILLCFVGALHPATDLTAGEKERGTLETILAAPVERSEIVAGKFFMVLTASLITAAVSLASFTATFTLPFVAARELGKFGKSFSFDLSMTGLLGVFALMIPLAVMFSAGLLALATFARTFKEAQSYASPLIAVVLMPAMAAMLPGFEPSAKLALIPILNVSLISKDMLTGNFQWGLIALVFASSCVYALGALSLAVAMFKRESILFRT
ncbi:MAG: ABC transporter permease [Verrucomicrobiota bacterium]